jgi:hypothetical protein
MVGAGDDCTENIKLRPGVELVIKVRVRFKIMG